MKTPKIGRYRRWFPVVLALALAPALTPAARADGSHGGVLILKLGRLHLSDTQQTIDAAPISFDARSGGALGGELEWRFRRHLGAGIELMHLRHEFTDGMYTSDADSTLVMANLKRYFELARWAYPYIGVGLGAGATRLSGGNFTGNGGSGAVQVMGGIEFRARRVGLYTEYKLLYFRPTDSNGQEINLSSHGGFIGLSVFFS